MCSAPALHGMSDAALSAPVTPASSGQEGQVGAEEWLRRYADEHGRLPANAEQLRAFALNRGARLPYSTARRAVATQPSHATSGISQSDVSPVPWQQREIPRESSNFRSWPPVRGGAPDGRSRHPDAAASSAVSDAVEPGPMASLLAVYENVRVSTLDSPIRLGMGDIAPGSWDADLALSLQRGSRRFPMDGERLIMWEAARQDLHAFFGRADARLLSDRADVIGSKTILDSCPVVTPECGSTCAICIDEADADCSMRWRKLPCGHVYHEECLAELVQLPHRRNCPLCRFDLANVTESVGGPQQGGQDHDRDALQGSDGLQQGMHLPAALGQEASGSGSAVTTVD